MILKFEIHSIHKINTVILSSDDIQFHTIFNQSFERPHFKQYEVSLISFPTVYRFWSIVFTKTYSNTGTFLYSFYSIFIFAQTSKIIDFK